MDELNPLLGTTLVMVAHPDDEVIVCGALMQRMEKAFVLFLTDGAPHGEDFWKQYGSRLAYAQIRIQEARLALAVVGANPLFLADQVEGGIADQELFRNLRSAIVGVESITALLKPNCMLTLAYEGGHPDHDAACFIASMVGRRAAIPVWESPLYHRNKDGVSMIQTFPRKIGTEMEMRVEGTQLEKKIRMFHHYRSQGLLIDSFRPERETFRPLADYDFTQPPLPWRLNYELWQWKMSGQEVSAAFSAFLQNQDGVGR